ncbi:hypothetical protein A9986_14005 [Solibacillus silvestris]|nr:hypothetical protein A9986_14005 [Solibacillus silvestris]
MLSIGSWFTLLIGAIAVVIGYLTDGLYSAKTLLDISITSFFQGFFVAYISLYMIYTFIYKFFFKVY